MVIVVTRIKARLGSGPYVFTEVRIRSIERNPGVGQRVADGITGLVTQSTHGVSLIEGSDLECQVLANQSMSLRGKIDV